MKAIDQALNPHAIGILANEMNEVANVILMGMREEPGRDDGSPLASFRKELIQPIVLAGREVPAVYDEEAAIMQLDHMTRTTIDGGLIELKLVQTSVHSQKILDTKRTVDRRCKSLRNDLSRSQRLTKYMQPLQP